MTEHDYYSIGRIGLHAVELQKTEGWKPRADSQSYLIPEPIDWSANPFDDANWLAQFHGWRLMDPHLHAYFVSDDPDYLRHIVPWLVSWPEFARDAPQEIAGALASTTGMRATRLALVLDAHLAGRLQLRRDALDALLDLARASAAHLMSADGIERSNHGYFQTLGLELLARVLEDEDWAPAGTARAREAIDDLIRSQFTDEGVHVENSPVYHGYALDQLRRSGAIDRMVAGDLRELLVRAEQVLPWYTFPDGAIADIGDSTGPGEPFTDAGSGKVVEIGDEPYAIAPFWRSGHAIVRSLPDMPPDEASMLLLVAASHSHMHSHADKLSFELFEFGRRLIVDTGKYGYVKDTMRKYVQSAAAHNTVDLADDPLGRMDVVLDGARPERPVVADDAIILRGEVRTQTDQVELTQRRQLTYRPGRSLIVHDALSCDSEQRFVSRLHFDRALKIRADGSGLVIDLGEGRSMRVTTTEGPIILRRGESGPPRGWQSVRYLQVEPTTTAEVTAGGMSVEMQWRIEFLPEVANEAASVAPYESDIGDYDYYSIGRMGAPAAELRKTAGWKARSDSQPYAIPEPIDWTVTPAGDANWAAQFHGWRHMDPHLRAYRDTGDAEYLRHVVPWAVSWAAYRANVPPDKHRTLDALSGMRATRLALILDAHLKQDLTLSADEFAVLLALARDSAAHLMTPSGIQRMNHGYFQLMGLELLGRVLPGEPWAAAAVERAREALGELLRSQFTDEGVHVENSPVYHHYALDQVRRSGAIDRMVSGSLVELLERARTVQPWFTFPDGGIADIGDSAGPGTLFEDAGDHIAQLGDRRYAVAPFWRSGYAIVRSLPDVPVERASMLLLVAAAHSHTHSHVDKLSFELFEFGRRVIVDSGKYGYIRDPMRAYVESAVAHNTVGLGDRPIKRTEVLLGGSRAFEPVVEGDAIVLTAEVIWDRGSLQFTHRRQMTYRPGRSLVIRDSLASETDREYVSRLHLDRSLEVRQDGAGLTVDLGEGRTMLLSTADGPISIHRGEVDPHRGWQSVGYMQVEPMTMAEVACSGRQRQIEWTITFRDEHGS